MVKSVTLYDSYHHSDLLLQHFLANQNGNQLSDLQWTGLNFERPEKINLMLGVEAFAFVKVYVLLKW